MDSTADAQLTWRRGLLAGLLLHEAPADHPDGSPAGADWVPARLGGGAADLRDERGSGGPGGGPVST